MFRLLTKLWVDEAGPTAVEYAIMVAVIAAVVIVGAQALGTNTNNTFNNVAGQLPNG
jgi:pilus assembly protein Flp/PilA